MRSGKVVIDRRKGTTKQPLEGYINENMDILAIKAI